MTGRRTETWRCTLERDGQTWHGTGETSESAYREAEYRQSVDPQEERTFGEATAHLACCLTNLRAWRESQTRFGAQEPPELVAAVHNAIERLRRCYVDRYGERT